MAHAYTYTFTKARLELILDEYEALLLRAGVHDQLAHKIGEALRRRMLDAVMLWAGRDTGSTIVKERQVKLAVDWAAHDHAMGQGHTTVSLDSKAWEGGVSPETRVYVRRFREAVDAENLDWGISFSLSDEFSSGPGLDEVQALLNLVWRKHEWAGSPDHQTSQLDEASELAYTISVVSR